MTQSPRRILIEFAESDEMKSLAVKLASGGNSIGLLQRGETSEKSIDTLQLRLEQAGGISCAFNTEKIEIALAKMQDLFGGVDEVVAFTTDFAAEVSRALESMPAKKRPRFCMDSERQ